jgi:hypothetical protein
VDASGALEEINVGGNVAQAANAIEGVLEDVVGCIGPCSDGLIGSGQGE